MTTLESVIVAHQRRLGPDEAVLGTHYDASSGRWIILVARDADEDLEDSPSEP
jgi:hypothetical protein